MDQHIESFLADFLALAGEDLDEIREGVRVALADCEEIFRAQKKAREEQGGSRPPRIKPRSRSREAAAPQGNAHWRAPKDRTQHHRPAGALN
jgi:hypothetical protein